MDKTMKFLKITAIYFFGNVLTKIISFLLIPLYTYLIKPESYGYYDLSISIISLIIPLTFFQIWDGMFRFIYDFKKDKDKYLIINNGLLISIGGIILYGILIKIINIYIPINYQFLIFLYGVSIGLQYVFGTVSRTFGKNKLYVISGISNSIVNIFFNILLIYFFKMDIESLYISVILGNIIQIIIISINLKIIKNLNIKNVDFNLIKKMLAFSIPIAITTISYWLLLGYSKVIINNLLGSADNGIFAIATRFSNMLLTIISVMQMAWHELSFSIVEDNNKKIYYDKGIKIFFKILSIGFLFVTPLTKVIFPFLVSNEYEQALKLMPIIYMYTAINAFSGFISTQFLAEKDSKTTLYTTIIAAVFNVILSYILTDYYGLIGTSVALLICFSINTILKVKLLKKKFKITILKKEILIFVFLTIVCFFSFYFFNNFFNLIFDLIILIIAGIMFKNEIKYIFKKYKERSV